MRNLFSAAVLAAFLLIFSFAAVAADSWEAYTQLMSKYYFWRSENMDGVTCRLTLSMLNPEKVREQLGLGGNNVALNENLRDFTVSYSRENGITFNKPHFEITILSKNGVKDLDKFELGVKMINQGAKIQIDGTAETVNAILRTFMRPEKEALEGVQISAEGETLTLKYNSEAGSTTQVYSGSTRITKTRTAEGEFETTDQFATLEGKLALATTTTRILQGQDTSVITTSIQYQYLEKVFFPSVLEQHAEILSEGIRQVVDMATTFTECKVK